MSPIRRRLARWFLPLIAALSVVTTLVFVGLNQNRPLLNALIQSAFALVLAGILFVVGYHYFTTTQLAETEANTVALWTLAGIGLLAVMNVWFRFLEFATGNSVTPRFAVVTSLTAGALGGAVVGIAIARARVHQIERNQALADYHEIFEKSEDVIFIEDPETGIFLEVNERAAEMLGYTVDELEGTSIEAISADAAEFDLERAMKKAQRVADGEPQRIDWLLERKDGTMLWVEVSLKQTTLGNENRFIALVRDISNRKAYERELEEAEQRFRSFAENAAFGVVTIDESSTVQYANDAVEDLFGYESSDLVGESLSTIMPERFRSQHDAGLARYLDTGERQLDWSGVELSGLHKEGHEIPLEVSFGELAVDDESLFTGALRDVSDRKQHEQMLAMRSDAIEGSIDGIAILDEDGEYQFVNQAHADIYGYEDPNESLGQTWHVCYGDDELARFEEEVIPLLYDEGAWRGEATGTRKDGSTFPQEVSLTVTSNGGLVCVVRDITERAEYEANLRVLNETSRELMTSQSKAAMVESIVDPASRLVDHRSSGCGRTAPSRTCWLRSQPSNHPPRTPRAPTSWRGS